MNIPMTTKSSSLVMIAYTDSESASEIEDVISLSPRFNTILVELDKLAEVGTASRADVIIFAMNAINDKEMETLVQLRTGFSGVPIIIVSEALSESQMRRLFKVHVHDWLPKPLDKKLLHSSLQSAVVNTLSSTTIVRAVVSASAGAGATTIATSLAQQLAKAKGKAKSSVALFDLDFSTGDCGYILNQSNEFGIDSVIENPSRIDAEFVNIIRQPHIGGFDIFSFKRPDVVINKNSTELVLRMLDAVSLQNDHTVLDVPYYETFWKEDVLAAVNSITVVTEMTLPSLRHAKELVDRIQKLRSDNFQLNVVINKFEYSMFGFSRDTKVLKELFGAFEVYKIARDASTLREAFDRGILPFEVNDRSKFLKNLRKFVTKSGFGDT